MSKVDKVREQFCTHCGKKFIASWNNGRWPVACSIRCRTWSGGRYIDKDGFVRVYTGENGNYISGLKHRFEHHLVAESILGRHLVGEHIIHIDGDNANNDPKNLYIFSSNSERCKARMRGEHPSLSNLEPLTYLKTVRGFPC